MRCARNRPVKLSPVQRWGEEGGEEKRDKRQGEEVDILELCISLGLVSKCGSRMSRWDN